MPLATTTVVAGETFGGLGDATFTGRTIFPEETPDQAVPDQGRRSMLLDISVVCLRHASINRTRRRMMRATKSEKRREQWCRKCIWGNLLPQWKQTFGSVEKVSSGDFVNLWTGRIDHLANRFNMAQGDAPISSSPESAGRRATTVARGNLRASRPHTRQLRAAVALAGRKRAILSPATTPPSSRIAQVRTRPGHAVAKAVRRATAG